jgi:predicted ester cyclase
MDILTTRISKTDLHTWTATDVELAGELYRHIPQYRTMLEGNWQNIPDLQYVVRIQDMFVPVKAVQEIITEAQRIPYQRTLKAAERLKELGFPVFVLI